ncbi:MAG: ATP-binding domain-containing protein [Pseudohongiella sp.]|nr:ATP-binding domain-containing protein [Pseudohongiella sp.]
MPALTRHREFVCFVDAILNQQAPAGAEELLDLLNMMGIDGSWLGVFCEAIEQFKLEFGEAQLRGASLVDWFYDYFRDMRQQPLDGLYLGTVHSAKGLEFLHVLMLDGGWLTELPTLEDERRLYYVGMTRAAQTLTLCEFESHNPFSSILSSSSVAIHWQGEYNPDLGKRYMTLALSEIDIGYAGRQPESAEIHRNIARLSVGSPLRWKEDSNNRYLMLDTDGNIVGRASASFRLDGLIESSTVAAVVVRYAEDSEEQYRDHNKCKRWEVVVPKVVLSPIK